jgi:hypothetical protein
LQLALLGPAFPCEGQKGAVIFEDNFQDDSGGWDLDSKIHVKASELIMSVGKDFASGQAQNLTFNATDGDYCVEFVLPPAPKPAYIPQIGLEFWALSYNDQFLAYVQSTGVFLARKQGGNWTTFFPGE